MEERQCTREELAQILAAQREIYLRPDDKILFVVDEGYFRVPINRVFRAYEYDVVRIPRVERPGQDYELDEYLLKGKTLGWLITSVSISHAPSTGKILDRKMYLISNPSITPDWPAILNPVNREPCQRRARAILKAMGGDVGGGFRVTSDDGTDLQLKVPDQNWELGVGSREGIGTNGPYGELFTAPYWSEGVYVLGPGDFLTNPVNEIQEEIRLTIVDNHVVRIEGGSQAQTLRKMLEEPDDPKAFSLGEFSFGLNPGRPDQLYRSVIAEKLSGGIHVAIGTNSVCLKETCPEISKFQYGRYSAKVHVDAIKFGARVSFQTEKKQWSAEEAAWVTPDPVTIVRDGRLVV